MAISKTSFSTVKMHVLQPKHSRMKPEEVEKLLKEFNVSVAQLPKISIKDPALPEGCKSGDVVLIERKSSLDNKTYNYYRVVV